jgi:hypothetical protein
MIPQKAGLYFAKSEKRYGWWNMIVDVQGNPPMLFISNAYYRGIDSKVVGHLIPYEIGEWGPEIIVPETEAKT